MKKQTRKTKISDGNLEWDLKYDYIPESKGDHITPSYPEEYYWEFPSGEEIKERYLNEMHYLKEECDNELVAEILYNLEMNCEAYEDKQTQKQ